MKKGMWIFVAVAALAVSAAVFDFQWEKLQEEKKDREAMVFPSKPEELTEVSMVLAKSFTVMKDGQSTVTNKMVLRRENDQWWIKAPIDELADQESVRMLISSLVNERAQDLGAEKVNWSDFGLDQPKGSFIVKDNKDRVTEIAVSTRKNFQGDAYLRRDAEEKVLLGSAGWYPRLDKELFDYRDKRPLRADASLIEKIRIREGALAAEFVVADSKWSLVSHPQWKLDQGKVRELLGQLTGPKLKSILAEGRIKKGDLKPFQGKTVAHIEVDMKEGKEWRAEIAPGPEHDYLVHIPEPSFLATMERADADRFFRLKLEELRDKSAPFDFKMSEMKKIELRSAEKSVELERKDDQWRVVEKSDPQLDVDPKKVSTLVSRLQSLEAMQYLGDQKKVPEAKKIAIKNAEGTPILELVFSDAKKQKVNGVERVVITAKSNLVEEAFALDELKVKDLGFDELFKVKSEAKKEKEPSTTEPGGSS